MPLLRMAIPGYTALDQMGLDWAWRTYQMRGPAPALPPGQGALFVLVPGSCDSADQVRAVEAVARGDASNTEASVGVYFDTECAELLRGDNPSTQSATLYVILVPLEVAASLAGPEAFIGCGGAAQVAGSTDDLEGLHCADAMENAVSVYSALP